MNPILPALVVLVALVTASSPARPDSEILDCDRLSAHPFDPDRPRGVAGASIDQLDADLAIAVCEQALARQPEHPRLQFQLARSLLKTGRSAEAVRLFRAAAGNGYAAAERNLGYLYYRGKVLPHDDDEAIKWFRRAAGRGHALAQHDLGKMYERGHGTQRDEAEAANWYRKSAEGMLTQGQHSLAYMYQAGIGVPEDRLEALKWFLIAEYLGDTYSGWVGRLAALHMSAEEKNKARRMAQDWLAARRD